MSDELSKMKKMLRCNRGSVSLCPAETPDTSGGTEPAAGACGMPGVVCVLTAPPAGNVGLTVPLSV